MSGKILAALFTLAFFAALAAWVPLLEATGNLLAAARRRQSIARLGKEDILPALSR